MKAVAKGASTDSSSFRGKDPCSSFQALSKNASFSDVIVPKNHYSSALQPQILLSSVLNTLPLHGLSLLFFKSSHFCSPQRSGTLIGYMFHFLQDCRGDGDTLILWINFAGLVHRI